MNINMMLSWEYKSVNNPQSITVRDEQDAKQHIAFIKRHGGALSPAYSKSQKTGDNMNGKEMSDELLKRFFSKRDAVIEEPPAEVKNAILEGFELAEYPVMLRLPKALVQAIEESKLFGMRPADLIEEGVVEIVMKDANFLSRIIASYATQKSATQH